MYLFKVLILQKYEFDFKKSLYTDHASEYRLNIDINPQNEVSLGIRLCHKDEGRLCTSHLHNEHYRVDVCIKIPR